MVGSRSVLLLYTSKKTYALPSRDSLSYWLTNGEFFWPSDTGISPNLGIFLTIASPA